MPGSAEIISTVERVVRRDRAITAAMLAVIALLAWVYLLRMDSGMGMSLPMPMPAGMPAPTDDMPGMDMDHMHMSMPGMVMPMAHSWTGRDVLLLFVMWSVMMVAMMLPSAAPTILLVLGAHRRRGGTAGVLASGIFLAGYLAIWTGFSGVATLAQWLLHRAAQLSPQMSAAAPALGGSLLIAAGVYQWLPLKYACLSHCRSPLGFLTSHWREGKFGALHMGAKHGIYCVGCCWALMALLFVAGVMNLLWVAILAAFVLLEKLAPGGPLIGRAAGVLLVAWGLWIFLRPL